MAAREPTPLAAPPAVELVLFDLDGTLVETAPELTDAVNDVLRAAGLATVGEAFVARTIGHGGPALLEQAVLIGAGGVVAALPPWSDLVAAFDRAAAARCGSRSRPYPHAAGLLQRLRAAGVRLALVTNKEGASTQRLLRAHALDAAFDHVICGDTLSTRKPDPAGVLECLRTLGVAPGRALFVGDSAIDAATARAAGVAVWLLSHGYNGGRPVAEASPDRVLPDLAAVAAALSLPSAC